MAPEKIKVSWSASTHYYEDEITQYDVEYCNNTAGDCANDQWSRETHTDLTSLELTIDYLTSGDTYKVRVRAENGRGSGPWSNTSSATPT